MRFHDRNVLVTGGASGIGAATALKFAQEGARVIVADRDLKKGSEVVSLIRELGSDGWLQEVDLADPASVARCGEAVAERITALHVLVNNAGIVRQSAIENTGPADWEPQMTINLRAQALMAKALLPLMKAQGAAVVNVSSEGAFRPRAGHWVYDATKAGICSLTRAMAVEFFPYGIRANCVAPGWTVTEMHFTAAPDPAARKRELEEKRDSACIMGRLGRPEEIAAAILFLASDEASYITATTLHVDGGLVAR